MHVELDALQSAERQWDLAPREPPIIEDDLLAEVDEWLRAEAELDELRPHGLEHYCECCRRLAGKATHRATFIGYSMVPKSPRGVCHFEN